MAPVWHSHCMIGNVASFNDIADVLATPFWNALS
jgi:hypothetical protein